VGLPKRSFARRLSSQEIASRRRFLIYSQLRNRRNLEKLLTFLPTAGRLQSGAIKCVSPGVDLMLTLDNPHPFLAGQVMRNIGLNYEKMRQVVLSQGYDGVWIIEEDMIPPLDALEKLSAIDADVVTGLYALRHKKHCPNLFDGKGDGIGNLYKWPLIQERWGETLEVGGGCMGCVLVKRRAIEKFCFLTNDCNAPDVPWMEHCMAQGMKTVARLDVVCGHVMGSGDVLWPDKEQGVRIEKAA
jgi:hypothetical protein